MYIHARTAIRAAKLQKNFHICKYMRRKVRNFLTLYDFLLILQEKCEVLRAKSGKNVRFEENQGVSCGVSSCVLSYVPSCVPSCVLRALTCRNFRQVRTTEKSSAIDDRLSPVQGRGQIVPPLQKKRSLRGFSITFFHSILQQYSFLAQRLNFTCHIMTNEEDCSALAYRGTILDTCTKITFW